jgi:hypothetical protein
MLFERLKGMGSRRVDEVCGPEGLLPHDIAQDADETFPTTTTPTPNIVLTAIELRPEPAEMPVKAAEAEIEANELAISALQVRQYKLWLRKKGKKPGE